MQIAWTTAIAPSRKEVRAGGCYEALFLSWRTISIIIQIPLALAGVGRLPMMLLIHFARSTQSMSEVMAGKI
jgi:hypothetical protein